jgi:spore germination cell wall hydrolase CwlJ-like protein
MKFVSHQVKGGLMEKSIRFISYLVGVLAVILLVNGITQTKLKVLEERAGLQSSDIVTIKTRERQLDCLAINIYREAGNQSFEGKVAVAQVTMNRVEDGRFGNDVCGVVYQKNVVMDRIVCQFSWYCDSTHKNRPINKPVYQESYEVAKKVLLEGFRLSVLNDALYFHANYVSPRWPHEKIGQIGDHIFYKPRERKI